MKFNERELEEAEALSHYIKYVLTDSQIEDWKVWDAIKKLEALSKIIMERNIEDTELPECLKLGDMKALVEKLFSILEKHLTEKKG